MLRSGVRAPSPPTTPQRPPPLPSGPRRGERPSDPLLAGAGGLELPCPDSCPLPTSRENRGSRPRTPPPRPPQLARKSKDSGSSVAAAAGTAAVGR